MSYRTLVVSMKRLYKKGKITKEDLQSRVKTEDNPNGTISAEEYNYITGEDYTG